VIAIPTAPKERIKTIHKRLSPYFKQIKILPTIEEILQEKNYSSMLQDISIEDLLARHPKDLDKNAIKKFINGKRVLITGAGGSIGSEISRQCVNFDASELILLDHSEFNLYKISEELNSYKPKVVMQSVVNRELVDETFKKYKPDIVVHAAAYKHVPLVEENITEAVLNNIIGTKNIIDCAIKHRVQKFVLISTDKAVRPTNVMGATKRVCELYAQNINTEENTEIVSVRFGNVLGSSGSVIPKFKSQISSGGPITVTHPDITRYFMLIPEACELVLQATSIGKGGEIFILDMGKPIKIVDLAKKMIELSGRDDIEIEFSGLRPGEKLYEELLISDSEMKTEYESITVADKSEYSIEKLDRDIKELVSTDQKLKKLKDIVPEFKHAV
jgi:FlaA1/EpsC-like NDP-sugar epimerase